MTALSYDDIVWACSNLCELLETENEALSRHDVAAMRDLAANKAEVVRAYEQAIAPLAAAPGWTDHLPQEQKADLTQLGQRLKDLIEQNLQILQSEMEANQFLMNTLVGAAKSRAATTPTYGPGGIAGGETTTASINLNQTA